MFDVEIHTTLMIQVSLKGEGITVQDAILNAKQKQPTILFKPSHTSHWKFDPEFYQNILKRLQDDLAQKGAA